MQPQLLSLSVRAKSLALIYLESVPSSNDMLLDLFFVVVAPVAAQLRKAIRKALFILLL